MTTPLPTADVRPRAPRRSASPYALGSATTGARDTNRSGKIPLASQPTKRGHFKPPRRGHCNLPLPAPSNRATTNGPRRAFRLFDGAVVPKGAIGWRRGAQPGRTFMWGSRLFRRLAPAYDCSCPNFPIRPRRRRAAGRMVGPAAGSLRRAARAWQAGL
jgi:hypothetical protein